MSKRFALCLICWMMALHLGLTQALAQSEPSSDDPQAAQALEAPQPPQPGVSADDPRLLLMIRNAIIALNQANLTGNYSVLREMGTPNFQITNSPARLAEAFAGLRFRKIDMSPIMFFNPKFASPPSMQDGQLVRVTGVFTTTPEQVNFDLAFQVLGDQWMIAAIAVNVAPPGDDLQASTAPALQAARSADAAETRPTRIDLTQPSAPASAQPAAPKKAATKKPKPRPQKTAAAQPAGLPAPAAAPPQHPSQTPTLAPLSSSGPTWNPFGR